MPEKFKVVVSRPGHPDVEFDVPARPVDGSIVAALLPYIRTEGNANPLLTVHHGPKTPGINFVYKSLKKDPETNQPVITIDVWHHY